MLPSRTLDALVKPAPVTVMTVSLAPASIADGLIALSAGGRLNADPVTVTDAFAALFDVVGSFSDPLTSTFMVAVPALICWTTKVTVALPPLLRPPRSQLSAPEVEQVPTEGVAETSKPVVGNCAVSATLVEGDGPLSVTVAV